MNDLDLPFHPTIPGMRAIGFLRSGKPVWPVMGGSQPAGDPANNPPADPPADSPADPPADPSATDPPGSDNDRGFPANTAVKDMKPEEQAAYWRFHDRRKSDTLKAYGGITPEEAVRLRDAEEQRRREGLPPNERALEDARQEAARTAQQDVASQFATDLAEEIATRFIPDDHARTAVMAGIEPSKFLKDGKFDRQGFTDHLTGLQTAFGGGAGAGGHQPRQWGQGNGRPPSTQKQSDEGLAEARRRGYVD